MITLHREIPPIRHQGTSCKISVSLSPGNLHQYPVVGVNTKDYRSYENTID